MRIAWRSVGHIVTRVVADAQRELAMIEQTGPT
jgi:hypothetical protein